MFEKVKYDQLYSAFTSIFSDNMSGFLRGHSCCSALLKLTDDWRLAPDKKKDVGVVAIDQSPEPGAHVKNNKSITTYITITLISKR